MKTTPNTQPAIKDKLLQLALSVAKTGVWTWDVQSNELVWSDELKKLYGLSPHETITYKRYYALIHPDDRTHTQNVINKAMETGSSYRLEHRAVWADGSIHWILGQGRAFREKGSIARMVGTGMDIDERKQAETMLQQSEDRYQAFIHNSSEGIWRVELEKPIPTSLSVKRQITMMYQYGYMAEANDAMAQMYGFASNKELRGVRLGDLLVADDKRNVEYLTAFVASNYQLSGVESHEVDKHGQPKVFRNSLVGIVEDGQLVRAWGTQQDVTQQHKTLVALAESEARFRSMADTAPVLIWMSGPDKKCTYFNQGWLEFTGRSLEQEQGDGWMQDIHPKDLHMCYKTYSNAFDARKPFQMEYRMRRHDGQYRWLLDSGAPRFSADGEFVGYIGSCFDIEDIKTAVARQDELETINQKLETQRKQLIALNQSKDEFISLASHQLRTPATGVKQYIGMLLEGFGGELHEDQIHLLRVAYESNERQLGIIDDLLKVAVVDADKVVLKKERVDMVVLVSDVLRELSNKFKAKRQTVVFEPSTKRMSIKLDRQKMRMALENIIDNANKYTPEKKTITVTLERQGRSVVVRIRDQGVGIAKKDVDKLFQKFSRVNNTLSTVVGGSGLGLYWAKRIIILHKGTIEVTSQLRRGTEFTITLPKE